MMFKFNKVYKKYLEERRGNVAVTSAILLPVTLMFGIGAVDYGLMTKSTQNMKQAANAAALAAVNEAQIAFNAREDVDLEELMKTTAERVFASRTDNLEFIDIKNVEVVPKALGNRLSATVNYHGEYKPQIVGVVGPSSYKIADSQKAVVSMASYIAINLVFDTSASMGVGATTADQRLMQDNIGCTFGCHQDNTSLEDSTYGQAKRLGATMRIDVAREAAYRSLDVAQQNVSVDNQIAMGLYKYASYSEKILDASDANATDMNHIRQLIDDNIFLAERRNAGSSTEVSIAEIAASLPDSGTGRTPNDRVQYLVVLTDGVDGHRFLPADRQKWNTPNGYGVWAPEGAHCSAIRDKGIHIFFIQTEYLTPFFGHHTQIFDWIDANINPTLENKLADCTGSLDQVFKTTTPEEIDQAFRDVMSDISTPLRLY